MTLRPIAILLLLSTATAGSARDRIPAAVPDGAPRACVPLQKLRESIVRSDRIIDFRIARDRYYRVTLPQACPGLGFERRFSYATSLSQLCAQDIITVLMQAPPMAGASCGLAPFQPVRIAR
ncbi:hypothetical protein ASG29_08930 [Sphingomonas sp. Leaf412]|uniref:hypothetical protein n=1 Tax=Sphingomonas sp. Leaf412 TaxID=1736370 RepID=UPI0006F275EA|nr:hypothetical protein [Sphingomonas sp. Leaf412]KQT31978.1 hypothetical protein ASG29_08930 [Sphingomonas sp. Leaf412]